MINVRNFSPVIRLLLLGGVVASPQPAPGRKSPLPCRVIARLRAVTRVLDLPRVMTVRGPPPRRRVSARRGGAGALLK